MRPPRGGKLCAMPCTLHVQGHSSRGVHARARLETRARTWVHTCTRTRTRARARTHTNRQTDKHTRAHTHTYTLWGVGRARGVGTNPHPRTLKIHSAVKKDVTKFHTASTKVFEIKSLSEIRPSTFYGTESLSEIRPSMLIGTWLGPGTDKIFVSECLQTLIGGSDLMISANVDGRVPLNDSCGFNATRRRAWVSSVWDLVINFFHGVGQNRNFPQLCCSREQQQKSKRFTSIGPGGVST